MLRSLAVIVHEIGITKNAMWSKLCFGDFKFLDGWASKGFAFMYVGASTAASCKCESAPPSSPSAMRCDVRPVGAVKQHQTLCVATLIFFSGSVHGIEFLFASRSLVLPQFIKDIAVSLASSIGVTVDQGHLSQLVVLVSQCRTYIYRRPRL